MAVRILLPTSAPPWLPGYNRQVEREVAKAAQMPTYLVADMPDPVASGRVWIFVSNAAGGAIPAFSDGTNWRRADTRAIVT